MSHIIISGVEKKASLNELKKTIKDVFLQATNNLSWLKPGQTVLLKPALNSNNTYPATCHPLLVSVLKKTIEEYGGKVIIGDQSGVESVVNNQHGVIKGSSANNFENSNMGKKESFTAFETADWDIGFKLYKSDLAKSWPNGFYYTKYVDKADHFINLSRLSTHAQAGITGTFKNLVGILRTDSRLDFHNNGPFNDVIQKHAKGANLNIPDDNSNSFIEKITEISLAVKDKLRLNMCVGTQAQVTLGPDRKIGIFKSHVVEPDFGLTFASPDPIATEIIATAELTRLYKKINFTHKLLQKYLIFLNKTIIELGKYAPKDSLFVEHAIKLELGNPNFEIKYINVPAEIQQELNELIK